MTQCSLEATITSSSDLYMKSGFACLLPRDRALQATERNEASKYDKQSATDDQFTYHLSPVLHNCCTVS